MEMVTEMELTLDEIIDVDGIEGMNGLLDQYLEQQGISGIASDISYFVGGLGEGGLITVKASYYLESLEEDYEGEFDNEDESGDELLPN